MDSGGTWPPASQCRVFVVAGRVWWGGVGGVVAGCGVVGCGRV